MPDVVVALFGKERAPDVLTEMGLALSKDDALEVVHLTEVPEQTDLDDINTRSLEVLGIERRIEHMSERVQANVSFVPIVTRDIYKTVNDISQRLHCNWLVTEWRGKIRGAFTLHNPMGWLRYHLSANLMTFRDKGVRYFKKIMVIVTTDKSNEFLLKVASHLAQVYNAEITLCAYEKKGSSSETIRWSQKKLRRHEAFL